MAEFGVIPAEFVELLAGSAGCGGLPGPKSGTWGTQFLWRGRLPGSWGTRRPVSVVELASWELGQPPDSGGICGAARGFGGLWWSPRSQNRDLGQPVSVALRPRSVRAEAR